MASFYEIIEVIKPYIQKPSIDAYYFIEKYFKNRGIKTYFDRELLKSDLLRWYTVFKEINHFEASNFPKVNDKKAILFWNELNFLEQISRNFNNSKYDEVQIEFLVIVDKFIDYLSELSTDNIDIHTHNDWILFSIIQNFDKDNIRIKHIEFMNQAISRHKHHSLIVSEINKSFLSKLIQCDDDIICAFFGVLFSYDINTDKYGDKFNPRVEEYWLKEILEKSVDLLNPSQFKILINSLLEQLIRMSKEEPFAFTSFKIPSIENSEQRRDYDKSITILLVDFIRNLFEKQLAVDIRTDVETMLNSDEIILKRLAIHLINHFFTDLREIFFKYDGNLIENKDLSHEIYVLLEKQNDVFSEEEIEKVINLIELQDFSYLEKEEDNEKYGEGRKAYRKRKYYYALKDSTTHTVFKDKFEEYNEMLDEEDKHPSFDSYWSGVQRLGLNSPKTMEQIKSMSTSNLVTYINEEFVEDKNEFNGPTHNALSEKINTIIISDSSYYINDLSLLVELNEQYFYKIIDAYKKCLQDKKVVDIDKILDYMIYFMSKHNDGKEIKYWYVSNPISEFIRELSSSKKDYEISDESHNKILEVLVDADMFISSCNEENIQNDHISHMLNAPKGQLFSAMTIYSLKYTRDKKLEDNRWIKEIKDLFTKRLLEYNSIDLFTVLGYYLPNISYLDNAWLEDNYKNIFGKDVPDIYWEASMSGYLHNSTMYLGLYSDVCETGSFIRGLDYKFSDSDNRQFVNFICMAFNSEYEDIKDTSSMIYLLLSKGDEKQLKEAISFFQDTVNKNKSNLERVIKPFWEKTLSEIINKQYNSLHLELIELITAIEVIDEETFALIINSIDNIDSVENHNYWLLDSFIRLLSSSPKFVSQIYVKLLEKSSFSTYEIDKIEQIIDYLYQNELSTYADQLCNMYGEYGEYRLEGLYRKYNS